MAIIRKIPCDVCGKEIFNPVLTKKSGRGEVFRVVRCANCGLVQVNPQPDLDAVRPYYESSYFNRRTDRGYDNYYTEEMKQAITRVYDLNLSDLKFYEYEREVFASNDTKPLTLDVGCAAGYFVDHMNDRGWDAMGIEVSPEASRFGRDKLKLRILTDDFLTCGDLKPGEFDFITFWASIEHMHSPMDVLRRSYELLKPGGRMILSTCRYGLLARWRGVNWRYMNVPEHLFFFSLKGIKEAAKQSGFRCIKHVTYGSGFTARTDANIWYRMAKRFADPLVKLLGQGDMMAIHLVREEGDANGSIRAS